MARAGGGGSMRGGGGGGRSFGGRTGGGAGGSFQRGGVRGGGAGPRPGGLGGAPRPTVRPPMGGGPRPGAGPGFGGFGGYGGYGGYGYGPGVPPPPPRRRRRSFWGPGYYGGGGCFTLVVMVVLLAALFTSTVFAAPAAVLAPGREKLPAGAVNQTGYYTDELGWVQNSSLLLPGLEHFYQETGVQPYLYLTDNINGNPYPTGAEAQGFAEALYDSLFTDEGHYLLVFLEYNAQYQMWYLAGSDAARVMDTEASDRLLDNIEKNYTRQNLSDEQMFSNAFKDTADSIMGRQARSWIVVLIIIGVALLLLVLFIWRRGARRQRYGEPVELHPLPPTYEDSRTESIERRYTENDEMR